MMHRYYPFLLSLFLISSVLQAEQKFIPSYKDFGRIQVTQEPNVRWRLFPTHVVDTFLQLDTVTGCIFQLHCPPTDIGFSGVLLLNGKNLAEGEKETAGRFTLYPTQQMYAFILLDQIRGYAWRVQWHDKEEYRLCIPLSVPGKQ